MMSALRRPNLLTVSAALFGLWNPVIAAVFFGRREQTVLTAMILLLSLFFQRGVSPPRWLVVAGILAAGFLLPITSEYRTYAREDGLRALSRFDPVEAIVEGYQNGRAPELSHAAHVIAAAHDSGEYGYGRGYWNTMVFRFVPAQLVGRDTKDALLLPNPSERSLVLTRGTSVSGGTTQTGIADSFAEFGYFGCLFFAGVGALFRNIWVAASGLRSLSAQLLYMVTLTGSMRALTHQTWDFLPGLTYNVIFLGIVYWYARDGGGKH